MYTYCYLSKFVQNWYESRSWFMTNLDGSLARSSTIHALFFSWLLFRIPSQSTFGPSSYKSNRLLEFRIPWLNLGPSVQGWPMATIPGLATLEVYLFSCCIKLICLLGKSMPPHLGIYHSYLFCPALQMFRAWTLENLFELAPFWGPSISPRT